MSRFIRFTNLILNTHDIKKIIIDKNKYYIYTRTPKIDGVDFKIAGSGAGWISSKDEHEIEVCETKNPVDYKVITDWISTIK